MQYVSFLFMLLYFILGKIVDATNFFAELT